MCFLLSLRPGYCPGFFLAVGRDVRVINIDAGRANGGATLRALAASRKRSGQAAREP